MSAGECDADGWRYWGSDAWIMRFGPCDTSGISPVEMFFRGTCIGPQGPQGPQSTGNKVKFKCSYYVLGSIFRGAWASMSEWPWYRDEMQRVRLHTSQEEIEAIRFDGCWRTNGKVIRASEHDTILTEIGNAYSSG